MSGKRKRRGCGAISHCKDFAFPVDSGTGASLTLWSVKAYRPSRTHPKGRGRRSSGHAFLLKHDPVRHVESRIANGTLLALRLPVSFLMHLLVVLIWRPVDPKLKRDHPRLPCAAVPGGLSHFGDPEGEIHANSGRDRRKGRLSFTEPIDNLLLRLVDFAKCDWAHETQTLGQTAMSVT